MLSADKTGDSKHLGVKSTLSDIFTLVFVRNSRQNLIDDKKLFDVDSHIKYQMQYLVDAYKKQTNRAQPQLSRNESKQLLRDTLNRFQS